VNPFLFTGKPRFSNSDSGLRECIIAHYLVLRAGLFFSVAFFWHCGRLFSRSLLVSGDECQWKKRTMEKLIDAQRELYGRIARSIENLRKAGAAKMTIALIQSADCGSSIASGPRLRPSTIA